MACAPIQSGAGFVSGVIGFVDCQSQTLGESGYQALAAPGSSFSLALTGLLTLFVALFGYRMLLGQVPGVRDGVLAIAKIGIVLALATSWPAYRTLFYDVALHGPAELAAEIGGPSGVPGTTGGLVARLDFADRAMVALAVAGVGPAPAATDAPRTDVAPPLFGGYDGFALGGARIAYLIGVIGAFAAVRLVAGLLLALAPIFIAFLLFDGTRGLFEGWLRVLVGASLGALGITIVLGIELALIEPWLIDLLQRRAAEIPIPSAPTELLVITSVFGIVLATMLYACMRLALGFNLARLWRTAEARVAPVLRRETRSALVERMGAPAPAETRSRAAAVVDAVAASQRREAAVVTAAAAAGSPSRAQVTQAMRGESVVATAPLGQSFRRRTGTRVSASAGRRDRRG